MPPLTQAQFLAKATAKHNGFYTYDKTRYTRGVDSIVITCPIHGDFHQKGVDHLAGNGCKDCKRDKIGASKRMSFAQFKEKALKIHRDKGYTYTPVVLKSNKDVITIACPTHGSFTKSVVKHLCGQGCQECAKQSVAESHTHKADTVIPALKAKGFTVIDPSTLAGMTKLIDVCCDVCGHKDTKSPQQLLVQKYGCNICAKRAVGKAKVKTWEFVKKSIVDLWAGVYTRFDPTQYKNSKSKIGVYCGASYKTTGKHHGWFWVRPNDLLSGHGCPRCGNSRNSIQEDNLLAFVQAIRPSAVRGSAATTPGKRRFAPDIIIPELKLAIEYDGLKWHSENVCGTAQREKLDYFNSHGWDIIFIFEDEWLYRQEAVKNRLRARLGDATAPRTFARKLKVTHLDWSVAKKCLDVWHTQGAGVPGQICLALELDGVPVAVAVFGRARFQNDGWEFLRYASDGVVVGGMGRLVRAFQREMPGVSLVSYADLRWGSGESYKSLGFVEEGRTKPGYSYAKGTKRYSRQKFQKHKLSGVLKVFDPLLTEVENCAANYYYRIFDCGSSKWRLEA